jgi:hypothetical protein
VVLVLDLARPTVEGWGRVACVLGLEATMPGKYKSDKSISRLKTLSSYTPLTPSLLVPRIRILIVLVRVEHYDAAPFSSSRRPCACSATKS